MAKDDVILRSMRADEFDAVAEVVFASTNTWYRANRGFEVFNAGVASCRLFPETYEVMDPGCCVVAEDPAKAGRLMGSCFYHPRDTHVSLGILNVHPDSFGRGVASRLLRYVTDFATREGKPVRLVSSAMNLDSFSLYARAGFVPRAVFADMMIPAERVAAIDCPEAERVRPATAGDVPAMIALEEEVSGIRREQDLRFFVENGQKVWHALVYEDRGRVDGFLASVHHPASHMLGPGVMRDDDAAAALIAAQLRHHAGRSPIFLMPLDRPGLAQRMYGWGAKNVELHLLQVLGAFQPIRGVAMPTFMPETG